MANEQQQLRFDSVSKFVKTHLQLYHIYRFLFIVIGLSAGQVVVGLYLKKYPITVPASHFSAYAPIAFSTLLPFSSTNGSTPYYTILSRKEQRFIDHNMTDEELLQMAVKVRRSVSKQYVPKVAFMFLTKGPLPFAPLWEKFFKDHEGLYSVYLHSHPSYEETFPENSVFYGRRIPSQVSLIFSQI